MKNQIPAWLFSNFDIKKTHDIESLPPANL